MTIEEAQEECKRRFPIGCKFTCVFGGKSTELLDDDVVYTIWENRQIFAHDGGGVLYDDSKGEFCFAKTDYKAPKIKKEKDELKPLIKLLKEII